MDMNADMTIYKNTLDDDLWEFNITHNSETSTFRYTLKDILDYINTENRRIYGVHKICIHKDLWTQLNDYLTTKHTDSIHPKNKIYIDATFSRNWIRTFGCTCARSMEKADVIAFTPKYNDEVANFDLNDEYCGNTYCSMDKFTSRLQEFDLWIHYARCGKDVISYFDLYKNCATALPPLTKDSYSELMQLLNSDDKKTAQTGIALLVQTNLSTSPFIASRLYHAANRAKKRFRFTTSVEWNTLEQLQIFTVTYKCSLEDLSIDPHVLDNTIRDLISVFDNLSEPKIFNYFGTKLIEKVNEAIVNNTILSDTELKSAFNIDTDDD